MGGLDNLAELKVLNLAGNQIRKISNMQGLISLEELNIRRNRIRSTTGLVSTTLEKLFISNNELQVYLFKAIVIHLSISKEQINFVSKLPPALWKVLQLGAGPESL